jgi:hypothetical protein
MSIGVSCGNVGLVEFQSRAEKILRDGITLGKGVKEIGYGMAPCLRP